jgi:tRNA(Ile)-lysidine synthase
MARHGADLPGSRRTAEALRQALTARTDAQLMIEVGQATLRRFDGHIYMVPANAVPSRDFTRLWRGERALNMSALNGVLTMTRCRGAGISLARLRANAVTIRLRRGAERLQPECGRPHRSLKNLLQEFRIPPWQRDRLPLLYSGGDLVWVPGIGIACEYQATAGEPAIAPAWLSAPLD